MRFLKTTLLLLTSIAIIHCLALSHALYVLIPHLDTVVHTMAGFAVGLAAISLFENMYAPTKGSHNTLKVFIGLLVASIFIGVGWEVFEKMIGFTSYLDTVDTATDLGADIAGSLLAYGYYRFIIW